MPGIGGDLAERRRARLKEPRVQTRTVPIGQRQECMREREDDVHIRHVEELTLARLEPALPRLGLALWAVPIPTRVIGDGLMSAGVAPIEMAAERGGATARDRAEHRALLHAQPRMLLEEGVTLRVEDIGHLHGRPAHDCGGFRFSRDRGEDHRRRHLQLLERIGRRLQVARRECRYTVVCVEVRVAQQDLDRAQVRAGLQQMRRVRMSQCVRTDATVDAGRAGGESHGFPDDLRGEGLSARQPSCVPGKRYVCGRIQR